MNLTEILNNPIVQILLALITLIEFTVSIVSYYKISKVRESQIEYRDIIELDTILSNLNNNTDVLKRIRNTTEIDLSSELMNEIDQLVTANAVCLGAVNKANQILLNSDNNTQNKNSQQVIYHEKGYFDKYFFDNIILSAKQRVILYLKRNIRPFTLDNLNELIKLADKNITIDIFAFSTKTDRKILEEMRKTIPNCPDNNDLIQSQEINKQAYISKKRQMKKPNNINYYEYTGFPFSQFIVIDNKLYWGIVNFDKTNMSDPFADRPYLEMDISTHFAQYILSQQDEMKEKCRSKNLNY